METNDQNPKDKICLLIVKLFIFFSFSVILVNVDFPLYRLKMNRQFSMRYAISFRCCSMISLNLMANLVSAWNMACKSLY